MDVSVLIPTHGRACKLNACLRSLAAQETSASFEVLVGVDGDAGGEIVTPGGLADRLRVVRYPKRGYISVRHALLGEARGSLVLSLNDDVVCEAGLIAAHVDAHGLVSGPSVVTGRMSWMAVERATVFDALVQRTGVVFFRQPQRRGTERLAEVGPRDCFGLNLSVERGLLLEAGGFPDLRDVYGYDDVELAWRLASRGARTVYAFGAAVEHDHRYGPEDVLRREYLLGRSAWAYAGVNAAFSAWLFGRDIRCGEELRYSSEYLARERRDAARIEERFVSLGGLAADAATDEVLGVLEHGWVLLKRYLWRWGLVDASRGGALGWARLSDGG